MPYAESSGAGAISVPFRWERKLGLTGRENACTIACDRS